MSIACMTSKPYGTTELSVNGIAVHSQGALFRSSFAFCDDNASAISAVTQLDGIDIQADYRRRFLPTIAGNLFTKNPVNARPTDPQHQNGLGRLHGGLL
jgi:hypothetical protein